MCNSTSNGKCKVQKCKENHKKHFCKICHDKDSNHFSKSCPNGIILWHGTKLENLQSILTNGLYPSKVGCMGEGIYLTTKKEAFCIAQHRGKMNQTDYVVVQVKVNLGKTLELQTNYDYQGNWKNFYDSATRFHESWANIKTKFQEWIVKDMSQITIMGYYDKDSQFYDNKVIFKTKEYYYSNKQI
eukprot:403366474